MSLKKHYLPLILLLVFILGIVLRFYKLSDYLLFLGDQGRDVLVVKRMIVDHQWTLLGPTASVGGFYIGPIFYYFMLPFLAFWNLDPVGPAVLSVIFGLGTMALCYALGRKFFNNRVGLFAIVLAAISPKLVYISRFSWNPNPMPFFALLTILLTEIGVTSRRFVFTFLAGISVGIMLQLHYMDIVFVPILFLSLLLVSPRKLWIPHFFWTVAGILLGNSLFLLFEIRHGFPNTTAVLEFVTRKSNPVAPRSFNPFFLFDDMTRRLFEAIFQTRSWLVSIIYYVSVFGSIAWIVKKFRSVNKPQITIFIIWIIVGILGIGSYRGQLVDHYFGYLFPLPIFFMALTLDLVFNSRAKVVGFLALCVLSFVSFKNLYFWYPPNNLINQTKTIDNLTLELSEGRPYNFALITPGNSDHAYRYFLEVWNRPPVTIENPNVDPDRKTVTEQLIVVCEDINCKPLGHPLWQIAGFGRAEIYEERLGPAGIKVFKLVHYKGN